MTEAASQTEVHTLLDRTIRTSDQMCTAYAILRDTYKRRSFWLDFFILLLSAWLTAMVWVQPAIAEQLTPFRISKDIWLGVLSIGAFCLSLLQLQVNWKERAAKYHQAMSVLSTYVKELRSTCSSHSVPQIEAALTRYHLITESLESIPDGAFVSLKRRHRIKVAMSKHLDNNPGTSLWLLKCSIVFRDNMRLLRGKSNETPVK